MTVGVDWGHEHVQFVAEDDQGKLLWKQRASSRTDSIAAVIRLLRELAAKGGTDVVAVAIEQKTSRMIEAFLGAGFEVWFARPEQVDVARKLRFSSRAKDDLRDALTMAWMLRSMQDGLISVKPAQSEVSELQGLTRARRGVVADRTAVRNQITGLLQECFPEMLELGKPELRWFAAVWRLVRTPEGAGRASVNEVQEVLRAHRVRKFTAEQVLDILRRGRTYVGRGDWTLVVELAFERHELLEKQIDRLEDRIEQHLAVMAENQRRNLAAASPQAPGPVLSDMEIVRSLPGVGSTLTAVMIAERLPDLLMADLELARTMSGAAPVFQGTGKRQTLGQGQISMRRACNGHLRDALHLAIEKGIQVDVWVADRYAALRARNHTHGRACRQVADSLLKRLHAMLRDRTLYEGVRRMAKAS